MSAVALATRRRPRPLRASRALGVSGTLAAIVLVAIVVVALLAPLLAPHDPDAVDILNPFAGASAAHPLGTDASGRDLLSRLIHGSRTALLGPLLVVGVSSLVGVALAIAAAWFGGLLDTLVARGLDVLFAFPGLLLAIIASAVLGAGLVTAALALSISYIPYIARIVRSEALRQRNLPYVQALWSQGVPAWAVCVRHLLPNLLPLLAAQVTLMLGYATVDVAAISYLGLGVQPPTADWGTMVAVGQAGIVQGHPQESLYAGLCLVVLVLAFTQLGDALADRARVSGS